MPPPPKVSNDTQKADEDSTRKELRYTCRLRVSFIIISVFLFCKFCTCVDYLNWKMNRRLHQTTVHVICVGNHHHIMGHVIL